MASAAVLSDTDALMQIKEGSRKLYTKAFDQLREFVDDDLETRPPSEEELLNYFKFLRFDKKLASSSLWTTYSMINGVCKGKYSLNLKSLCRVTSLIKIFSSSVDIRAVPKKLLLRALLEFTDSDEDRQLLTVLASKEGGAEYTAKVREPQLSLLDLLALVPSCRPPASLLLEHLPRLLPRPYSLSSSPSDSPGEISWIFTRVTEPRPGLATSWLSGLQAGSLLSVYPRTSHGFSPPEDLSADYIMVAAGSGIGPFIGFLKDRLARRERGDSVTGRCWLVFGCRYSDGDFLKKEFINQLKQSNLLSKLNVSFSREKLGGPKYVQDSLKLERETLFEWLHQNDATFYICGDAKGMATDVKKTVNEILSEKLGTESGAEFFKKLVADKRYREDIWS